MNLFLYSTIALCLVAGAHGSYQSSNSGYGNQRKMAPSPQTYGQQMQSYGDAMSAYEAPQQQQQAASYGAQQMQQPAASYGRPAAAAASAYAKPAPKYEEPYHPPMPFAWGYDINDGYGGAQYHKETGDEYGKRTGSYGYTDAYGVYRQVDYVADEHGFRATIKTNEPGTANESPADVELHAYEPPSNYYAGNRDQSYGGKSQGASSYGAPAAASAAYGQQQQQQSSSYGQQQQSSYGSGRAAAAAPSYAPRPQSSYAPAARAPQAQAYDSSAQYSSSAIVPVYRRAPVAPAAAPARRAY